MCLRRPRRFSTGPAAPMLPTMSASVPPPGYLPPPASAPEPAQAKSGLARRRAAGPRFVGGGLGIATAAAVAFVLFGGASSQLGNAIAQAATTSASTPGYKMQMRIEMSSPALSVPITASGSGVMDLRDHAASMSMAIDFSQLPQVAQVLGSSTMQMGMVMDGTVLYMKFPDALAARDPSLGAKPW